MPRYVTRFGGLWKIKDKKWVLLMQAVAAGREYNLDDLGKMLTSEVINMHAMEKEYGPSGGAQDGTVAEGQQVGDTGVDRVPGLPVHRHRRAKGAAR